MNSPFDKDQRYAILNGKEVVIANNLIEWGLTLQRQDRRVAFTLIDKRKNIYVSTVFLGLNHSTFGIVPLWFESMVFGSSMDGFQWRYTTWRQSEIGHSKIVGYVRNSKLIR